MNFWFILDSKNICLVHKNISIFIAFSCTFLKENHVNNYRKVKEPSFSLSSRNSTASIYDAELQTNKLHYPEFWFSPFQTPFLGSFSFPHHLWKQGGYFSKAGTELTILHNSTPFPRTKFTQVSCSP